MASDAVLEVIEALALEAAVKVGLDIQGWQKFDHSDRARLCNRSVLIDVSDTVL